MHHEKPVDESSECFTLRASFVAPQKRGNGLFCCVPICTLTNPAHDGPALNVERQEPSRAIFIYIEMLKLFRLPECIDRNAKRFREFTQTICF